ncbi:hypothetical protein [Streptomyces chartreusis]|uniref:hypothetical protein n=1 Tax=Streptomyces chartreusis TaxID=1969 RepID=UPI0037AED2B0
MTDPAHQNPDSQPATPSPKSPKRTSAQEVIQFVIEQKNLADLDVEIVFEALARLDDMSDDEAAALIVETMARIMFS